MRITTLEALAEKIKSCRDVTILTHSHPDGDCTGAGLGLCYYFRSVGVRANVKNSDGFPKLFDFLTDGYQDQEFEEKFVISVDVATPELLGDSLSCYAERVDLCIDHHRSNSGYAKDSYVDGGCCAACLIIYELLKLLGAKLTPLIADCLYTGISTDTGCFMFDSTGPGAHSAAAGLMEAGCRAAAINRRMFQIKSRGRILAEHRVIDTMTFSDDGRIALIAVTNEIIDGCGIDRAELDGFAGIPLSVEGVEIGITLKQQPDESYRASVRTVSADASAIAARFGGGGHIRAAGCTVGGTKEEAARAVMAVAAEYL